jgi:hypothetical protein
MAAHDYLEHTASDGTASIDRAIRAGYGARKGTGWTVTEVISAISGDPEGPLHWWLTESTGVHGAVLRDPRWREMGVGYASGGEYGNYWTVLVGCQPGVLPVVELDGTSYHHDEECDPSAPPPAATATPAPPTVTPAPPTPTPVPAPRRRVAARVNQLEFAWDGLTAPRPGDWVGLFSAGAPDSRYVAFVYLGCRYTPLVPPPEAGDCAMPLPPDAQPGDYQLRLFREGQPDAVARSDALTLLHEPT